MVVVVKDKEVGGLSKMQSMEARNVSEVKGKKCHVIKKNVQVKYIKIISKFGVLNTIYHNAGFLLFL